MVSSRGSVRLAIGAVIVVVVVAGLIWVLSEPGVVEQHPGERAEIEPEAIVLMPLPMTVAPGIHMLGRLRPGVAYVVETSTGLVLIDTGVEPSARELIAQLSEFSLKATQLTAILLTHAHGDHTLGARQLREISGAKIYAGQGDAEVLRAGKPREAFFSTFAMEGHRVHGTEIDVELEGGERLDFGNTKIKVIATPGHTPGSVCYLLERDHLRVLFAGDTISSLVGDIGTYSSYLAPRYRGNAEQYLDSLRRLRTLEVPSFVLPGHPTSSQVPNSPVLDESAWHQLLDRGIRDMEQLVARYEADGRDFLDGEAKQLLPGLFYLGDHGQRPIYALATATHQFVFDAPGSSGLADFVDERLKAAGIEVPAITAVLLTSCDGDSVAGLRELVSRFNCAVVAAETEHEQLRDQCPADTTLIGPGELNTMDWLPAKAIALAGRGQGAVAYSIPWESKTVLVSGKYPVSLSDASVMQLANELRSASGDPNQYVQSLKLLREEAPDLWLPAVISYGQNANMYGAQWASVIDSNLQLLGSSRAR